MIIDSIDIIFVIIFIEEYNLFQCTQFKPASFQVHISPTFDNIQLLVEEWYNRMVQMMWECWWGGLYQMQNCPVVSLGFMLQKWQHFPITRTPNDVEFSFGHHDLCHLMEYQRFCID